jgi:hypothetical protein
MSRSNEFITRSILGGLYWTAAFYVLETTQACQRFFLPGRHGQGLGIGRDSVSDDITASRTIVMALSESLIHIHDMYRCPP